MGGRVLGKGLNSRTCAPRVRVRPFTVCCHSCLWHAHASHGSFTRGGRRRHHRTGHGGMRKYVLKAPVACAPTNVGMHRSDWMRSVSFILTFQ